MKKILQNILITTLLISALTTSPEAQFGPPLNIQDVIKEINQKRESSEILTPTAPKNTQDVLIEEIKIQGNTTVSSGLILSQLSIRAGETVSPFKIDRNIRDIDALGLFEKVSHKITNTKTGKVLTFIVVENPIVTDIHLIGLTHFTRTEVLEKLKTKPTQLFNQRTIRDDMETIKALYTSKGFTRAKVTNVDLPTQDNPVLTFYISEGMISNIIITGNTKTKDHVIRREMSAKSGDIITQELIQKDIRRIYNLNYFQGIEPSLIPTENGKYDLQLDITERDNTGQFSFGGGYSPQSGFSIFSDLYWDNIMGTGQLILLKGQFGLGGKNSASDSRYQFKYHNPWMWDDQKSLTARVWRTDGEAVSALSTGGSDRFRKESRLGMDYTIGLPVNYDFRYTHKLKFEDVELKEFDQKYSVSSYTFGIIHDTRDVRFNPRSGHYIGTSVEKAFDISARSLEFTKYEASLKKFIPTFAKQTLALRLELGYLQSPTIRDETLFSSEYFRVGFSDTVRGQNEHNFQFGNKRVVSSVEYRFLFTDAFSLVLFADAGFATSEGLSYEKAQDLLMFGKGIGVRFLIPGLGPLSLDAGSDETGEIRIQVNIGHLF